MGYPIKSYTSYQPLIFMLTDSTTKLGKLNAASIVVTLSKNGGAPVTPAGAVSQVGGGLYKVAGNTTDSNTAGPLVLKATATGCDETFEVFHVVIYNPLGDLVSDSEKLQIAARVLDTGFIAYGTGPLAAIVVGSPYVAGDRGLYALTRATIASIQVAASPMTHLDVSQCGNLQSLAVYECELTSLDLSDTPNLTYLNCGNNSLETLDLSGCEAITGLYCNDNQIPEIVVHPSMQLVDCSNNLIESLDLTGLTALSSLDCSDNLLTALDVGDCAGLTALDCSGNQLTEIDGLADVVFTITSLKASRNQIATLLFMEGNYYNIATLHCDNNPLWQLELGNATGLTELHCHDTQITSLSCYAPGLREVDCARCQISSLNLNWSSLASLDCSSNALTELTVGSANSLLTLDCSGNSLTTLDPTLTYMLQTLNCRCNVLTSLTLTGMYSLATVDCSRNQLGVLNLNDVHISDTFDCSWNLLGALVPSPLVTVQHINCSNNQIMNLDVSDNVALLTLDVSFNLLGNVTLGSISSLTSINASNNPGMFTFPSLASNLGLVYLDVSYCNLPEAVLDQILADLFNNGATGGTLYMGNQSPPASPSGQGVAYASMLANDRGWTIQADGFYS